MITNEDICRINACLRKQFSKADLVLQSHSLRQDYKADNLDFVELAMSLEEEFKVDIDDDVFFNLESIEDLYNFISDLLENTSKY
jgi:acyl carrier protein